MSRGDVVLVRFPHPSGVRGKRLFIDLTTPEGQATGLAHDSVLSCLALATVYADAVDQTLGSLSLAMVQQLDGCLKVALGLP